MNKIISYHERWRRKALVANLGAPEIAGLLGVWATIKSLEIAIFTLFGQRAIIHLLDISSPPDDFSVSAPSWGACCGSAFKFARQGALNNSPL
jgi:hypothetical protein